MYSKHRDSNSFREENERKKFKRDHPVNANLSGLIDMNEEIDKILAAGTYISDSEFVCFFTSQLCRIEKNAIILYCTVEQIIFFSVVTMCSRERTQDSSV